MQKYIIIENGSQTEEKYFQSDEAMDKEVEYIIKQRSNWIDVHLDEMQVSDNYKINVINYEEFLAQNRTITRTIFIIRTYYKNNY